MEGILTILSTYWILILGFTVNLIVFSINEYFLEKNEVEDNNHLYYIILFFILTIAGLYAGYEGKGYLVFLPSYLAGFYLFYVLGSNTVTNRENKKIKKDMNKEFVLLNSILVLTNTIIVFYYLIF